MAATAGVSTVLLLPRLTNPTERLVSAGHTRSTPGRLIGERVHRPWRSDSQSFDSETESALNEARAAGTQPGTIETAVIQLVEGRTTRAIAGFELAARTHSSAMEALADLSAAYLKRFETEGDMLDALRAVEAADRGLALESTNATLHFNRATALTLLGTPVLARTAWKDVEKVERDGWRDEAAARVRSLQRVNDETEWSRLLPRIESPSTPKSELESLVTRWPAQARAFGEEVLLPRWAAAVVARDASAVERSLLLAESIGNILRRARGEELLCDAVASIRRTVAIGDSKQRDALLLGLRQFSDGVHQYNEQNLATASQVLASCATSLAAVDNPLRFWARFYAAIGESYADADRGLAILDALLREIPRERYPALVGRIEWIAGTIDKVQGRIQSSVRRYELSATNLRRAGGEPAAAFVSVLLAESYTGLGEHSLAWQNRRVAFRQVPYSEAPRRSIAMWTEAMEALLHQGSLRLAGPFLEEAVASAEQWGRPLGRATAYLDRANYRLEVGARGDALSDLGRAQAAIAQMEESPLRNQMTYLALIAEGLCNRASAPSKAAALLKRGLDGQQATGTRFDAITYTTALAEAQVSSGDVTGGTASLEHVLEIFENIRATVEDPGSRMQAFQQAQPAFDALLDLRTTKLSGDRDSAFLLAERSRARALLDLREGGRGALPGSVRFASLSDLEEALPDRVALASYMVLENRILVWVSEGGRTRQVTLDTRRTDLEKAIERFRLEMQRDGGVAAIRDAAAPLYDSLIRPLNLASGRDRTLIIVPDRWLARLPFAALFDRESATYLIEQRAVTITPSVTLLLAASPAAAPRNGVMIPALVIGVSRSGDYQGRPLPVLAHAEGEAKRIAALYPGASLLRGAEATPANFLRLSVSSNVVHFAGHAFVDLDSPRRSVLLFANERNEGLLPISLGELFDSGFGATRLVVLSACRAQDSLADDREGILGLAGAFIAGGVPEVIASSLDVDDATATPVMVAFHRHYRETRSASSAFRETVLELLHTGPPSVRSPAVWGGFTVIEGSLGERGSS